MTRINELVDMVGPKFFSSLDLMGGYHQVKDSKPFTCHLGLYQYRRIPFGLTIVPGTFQQLMSQLFLGPECVFVFAYLDDILVVSRSVEKHVLHVKKVLQCISGAGQRLKPSLLLCRLNTWGTHILLKELGPMMPRSQLSKNFQEHSQLKRCIPSNG